MHKTRGNSIKVLQDKEAIMILSFEIRVCKKIKGSKRKLLSKWAHEKGLQSEYWYLRSKMYIQSILEQLQYCIGNLYTINDFNNSNFPNNDILLEL